jgi:hypothetical protein
MSRFALPETDAEDSFPQRIRRIHDSDGQTSSASYLGLWPTQRRRARRGAPPSDMASELNGRYSSCPGCNRIERPKPQLKPCQIVARFLELGDESVVRRFTRARPLTRIAIADDYFYSNPDPYPTSDCRMEILHLLRILLQPFLE